MEHGVEVSRLAPPVPADLLALRRRVDAGRDPHDPPISERELAGWLFTPLPNQRRFAWAAHSGVRPVGLMRAVMEVGTVNQGLCEIEIEVSPGEIQLPVPSALVSAAVEELRGAGATSFLYCPSDRAGRVLAERIGLTLRQEERCSRLLLAEFDEEQQVGWLRAEAARRAGYRVVTWHGACPEAHLDQLAAALAAMADAPLDSLEYQPVTTTPDLLRATDAVLAEVGDVAVVSLALAAGGEAAGMTAIRVHPDRSQLGHQEDTGVLAPHRGYGLGRWLKAANLRHAREVFSELEVIETFNAESNPWMLGINVAMGFRPHRSYLAYQGPISEVSEKLASGTGS